MKRQGTSCHGCSFLSNWYSPLFYLRKQNNEVCYVFKGFFSVNLFCCYRLCVLYFLLFVYFHILFPSISFFRCLYFGVVERKTEGNIRSGLLPGFWNWDSQSNEQDSPSVSQLDFHLLLCPSILTDIKCIKFCVEASVNMFRRGKTKLPRKKMYIELTHEKSITARGQNDSVFININIYWVWQPSDCYMHFLGKLEDLYGSSFSTL